MSHVGPRWKGAVDTLGTRAGSGGWRKILHQDINRVYRHLGLTWFPHSFCNVNRIHLYQKKNLSRTDTELEN